MQRVQKLISNYGYCSRRKAEDLIKQGRVKVNGKVIELGDQAEESDEIKVDNNKLFVDDKIYLMFHKPVGCVCALKDREHKTIMDYIDIKERVYPVGRLDYNTSGIILLTNDGEFSNLITHPSHEITKTYLVGLYNEFDEGDKPRIEKGIELEDEITSPAKVFIKHERLIIITIHEGRNRIVRRILKALNYKVKFLKRIKIGRLDLDDLEEGKYRHLNKSDIDRLFD